MPQRKLFDQKTLKELKKHPLYSQDGKGDEAKAYAKIFNPYGRGYWFITEYDGDDTFFGYYRDNAHEAQTGYDSNDEYGYFSKKELENTRVKVWGQRMPLERDAYYRPQTIGVIKNGGNPVVKNSFENTRTSTTETNSNAGSKG